jgi:transcriptional regulator with XRE-family HTH domain
MLKIGRQMRRVRTERGFTHRQLAQAVGVTEGTISRIENDQSEPSAGTMAAIADFLGVTMDELRDAAPESTQPSELEALLIAAAQRAQAGDQAALLEMRRIASALGQAEEGAATARAATKKPVARKKGT